MHESEPEMSESRAREILRLLRDMPASEVQPSVRSAGLTESQARFLDSKQLILLVDGMPWQRELAKNTPFEDRFLIVGISDIAIAWLATNLTPPEPIAVRIEAPKISQSAKIFRWSAKTLWGWISAAIGAAILFFVGYYLKMHWK